MSSQVLENIGSNDVIRDYLQDVPLSSSYETAMDALSSLITHQNRRERSNVGGKYGKLERMLMYLKVTLLQFYYPVSMLGFGNVGDFGTAYYSETI